MQEVLSERICAMGVYEKAKQETRNKIVKSFWDLYKTRGIEKITVRDITNASGIYRTTFYLHFSDIYAILEIIEENLLKELQKLGEEPADTSEERQRYMEKMNQMLRDNCEYLHVLMDEQKNPDFARCYKKEMIRQICRNYDIDLSRLDDRAGIVIQRTLSSIMDLFFGWMNTNLFSFEEVIGIIDGYMNYGVLRTIRDGLIACSTQESFRSDMTKN